MTLTDTCPLVREMTLTDTCLLVRDMTLTDTCPLVREMTLTDTCHLVKDMTLTDTCPLVRDMTLTDPYATYIKSPPSISLLLQLPAESPSLLDDTIRSRNHPTAKANSPPSLSGAVHLNTTFSGPSTPLGEPDTCCWQPPYRFLPPPPT
ncbi:hypothetical protein CDAR_305681 [Caerostris darwini]|uniref:Uncharacterized protein n=1 Tax=Caerostris darwini TaxID=1538125 RepID=A0AAV4P9E4_9ARAC|nr:hypothetical protein CDAR_305681 [Caerostris darwini]